MSYFMTKLMERQNGVDDLTLMSGSATVSEIVTQLGYRLDRNKIYTAVGDVLIATNPYRVLPIYGKQHIKMYQTSMADSSPHVYGLAERAYRAMLELSRPQAVIISGESGAGKTENAKLFLHYVSSVSGSSEVSTNMKAIILQANPLLESFGNAKTIRNNNSSRFGKYLEVKFNGQGEPVGGVTSNFLLEKTRVCMQGQNERNFHIFYQMLVHVQQGGMPELREQCQLGSPEDYKYTRGCVYVDNVDDNKEFQEVLAAMNTIKIPSEYQWYVFTSLAAILHLGNFQFAKGMDAPAQPHQGTEYSLQMAAYLFGIDPAALYKAITHKTIQMGGRRASVVSVPQNADQASQIRDALAKETYSRIFDTIVQQLNNVMHTNQGVMGRTIGILDIYGFEIFKKNGFEQICINYVNEKLQQIFIELTVRGEQREYHQEGIQWRDIAYFDNKVVCELIEGGNPPGIFRVLDDTCRSLHAVDSDTADSNFIQKLGMSGISQHPHLRILGGTSAYNAAFTVKHYAGDVTYDVREFCFKNMDNLVNSLVDCMKQSQNPFLRQLWNRDDQQGPGKQPSTSSSKIRNSCGQLVQSLMRCSPHYIRCIKPNEQKRPMYIEEKRVVHQVKYLGLVENVKIKKAGYAYRAHYDMFLQRFHMLYKGQLQRGGVDGCRELCSYISKKHPEVSMSEWCFGRTKIFISSPPTVFMLEEFREQAMDPKGYAEKVKEHERMEAMANAAEATVAKRGSAKTCGCVIC